MCRAAPCANPERANERPDHTHRRPLCLLLVEVRCLVKIARFDLQPLEHEVLGRLACGAKRVAEQLERSLLAVARRRLLLRGGA